MKNIEDIIIGDILSVCDDYLHYNDEREVGDIRYNLQLDIEVIDIRHSRELPPEVKVHATVTVTNVTQNNKPLSVNERGIEKYAERYIERSA